MKNNRTISYHEHYVQVGFYQNFIKDKEKEIKDLKKQLDFSNQENEMLNAKLEVSQKQNYIMNKEKLKELYYKYELSKENIFTKQIGNKSFTIITREGIDKIQGIEKIKIEYDCIKTEPNFASLKAKAQKGDAYIETFGSALKGNNYKDGNCNSWYVIEIAEKRAMSRAVLKLTGFYALGVFGEEESDSFKQPEKKKTTKEELVTKIKKMYKEHNAFENQIFDHYRQQAKEINKAIVLLTEHNYTVIDHQGKWITKENIN